jgi:hypothetical protein
MAHKNLNNFINFLWDFDDGQSRKHWEDRAYRVLYRRCVTIIQTWYGEEEGEEFQEDVKMLFPIINWVVPYPNHTVFWQHTKGHERMWLSVFNPQIQAESESGQRLCWTDLVRILDDSQDWSIGRSMKAVLEGVPEEPRDGELNMELVKGSVLRKWQRHLASREEQ